MTSEFLTDLFGDQEGIVYSPVLNDIKNRKGWKQHFFDWPSERSQLEEHIGTFKQRDVYLSPVLFNEKRIASETFKGTRYLWTEFDGVVPSEFIEPTMRVMSSQPGHEHWYWKLDQFVTDKVFLEDLTRRIAYHYGADLSVWDYQNVLRPVDTWNHKRNKPVTLLSKTDVVYSANDFLWVPIPPAGTKVDFSLGTLPEREKILAKYKWRAETLDLIFKDAVATGKRSDALMRLAFDAIETGCSNEEIYVLIEDRDRVWKKYLGRNDREKQLRTIIARSRGKKASVAEITLGATEVYRFYDFMQTKITMKWAIEGLLPVAGSLIVMGKPGIGKSTFLLRLAEDLSLGRETFLSWPIVNKQRVLFVSLEMQHDELKSFFNDMKLPEEEQLALQEGFHIWPIGHAYPFDTPDQQIELIKYIKMHKIDVVIIDSLSLSMYGSIKDDDAVKRLNSFLNEDVRKDLKCGYIFIHHLRKDGIDKQRKDGDLDDSFGSIYITANAQTVLLLSQRPGSVKMHVKILKARMTKGEKEFDIERTPDRGFKLVGSNSTSTTVIPAIEQRETSGNKDADAGSLGKLFTL